MSPTAGFLRTISVVCAALLTLALAAAEPTFPSLTGRVVDQAGVLSPAAQARLAALSSDVEAKTGAQFVTATVRTLEGYDVADYGTRLGRHWSLGDAERNDGVLLLIAPNDRKVRIEVGYGLEGVITDALSSVILRREVLPRFKRGDLEGGALAGAEAVAAQILADPERQREANAAAQSRGSKKRPSQFWGVVVLVVVVGIAALVNSFNGGGGPPQGALGRRRRWRRGGLYGGGIAGGYYGGGGFGGGSYGGGGFGGGGFSGGGGSFGGGGASGGW